METISASVLLLEDDSAVAQAVLASLQRAEPTWDVRCVSTLREARRALESSTFCAALVDLSLPDGTALSLLPSMRDRAVAAVVLSSTADERTVFEALRLGAVGYLLKPDDIAQSASGVRAAMNGGSPVSPRIARWLIDEWRVRPAVESKTAGEEDGELTPREREMLELFAVGATYAQVGAALGISVNSVRSHVRNVYEKLHVATKTEAVLRGLGPR